MTYHDFFFSDNRPQNLTETEFLALPPFLFQLKVANKYKDPRTKGLDRFLDESNHDVSVALPPRNYMHHVDGSLSTKIVLVDFGAVILGVPLLMGHDVFFDVEGLGISESSCDYTTTHPTQSRMRHAPNANKKAYTRSGHKTANQSYTSSDIKGGNGGPTTTRAKGTMPKTRKTSREHEP